MKFENGVDLGNYQAKNLVVESVSTLPTGVVGKLVFCTADNTLQYYDGTAWKVVDTGAGVTIDSALSSTSENPVQNKIITSALGDYVDKTSTQTISGEKTFSASTTKVNQILRFSNTSNPYISIQSGSYTYYIQGYDSKLGAGPGWSSSTTIDNTGQVTFPSGKTPKVGTTSLALVDSPALTGTPTAPTASSGTNNTQIATTAFVQSAISGIPTPMQFKGTVGTDGTITTLPTAGSTNLGFVYKAISDGSSPVTYKSGDTVVCAELTSGTYSWVVIPSGDEPSGTVTNVATGAGLTGGPITESGTIKANLNSETSIGTIGTSGVKAVGVDSSGKLAVDMSDYLPLSGGTLTGSLTLTGTNGITSNNIIFNDWKLNVNRSASGKLYRFVGIDVNSTTGWLKTRSADDVKADLGIGRYEGTITGDGTTASFTLTHNLGKLPTVTVYDSSGNMTLVQFSATTTQLTFTFSTAPASGTTYTVVAVI